MKTFSKFILTTMLVVGALTVPITSYAKVRSNGTNLYRSEDFSESKERVEELEQTLVNDGYILVNSSVTENQEYTDLLLEEKSNLTLSTFITCNPKDYKVYVNDRDMQKLCSIDKDVEWGAYLDALAVVDANMCVCAYFPFNEKTETDMLVPTGNDIPMEVGVTTINFTLAEGTDTDKDISIILADNEGGLIKSTLTVINGYRDMQNVPENKYSLYSIKVDDNYIPVYDKEWDNGKVLVSNNTYTFEVSLSPREVYVEEVAEDIPEEVVEEATEVQKDNTVVKVVAIIIGIISLTAIIVITIIVIVKKKRNNEE